jgi:hypothetical protein
MQVWEKRQEQKIVGQLSHWKANNILKSSTEGIKEEPGQRGKVFREVSLTSGCSHSPETLAHNERWWRGSWLLRVGAGYKNGHGHICTQCSAG